MIRLHQKFDLHDKCLIEKVVVEPPFRLGVNFPNEACFIYFREGQANINSPTEQVSISSEESVLLKCGTYFADLLKHKGNGRYEILVFHLYPDLLKNIYRHEIPSFVRQAEDVSFIRKVVPDDTLQKFVESLYFYFDHPSLVSNELLELKIKELILLLIQTKNASSITSLFTDLFAPREAGIRDIVQQHLFSRLSVDDLASLAHLSPSTFKRSFREIYGDSPAGYIRKKRLERACELLKMGSLTVSEIAYETGFTDVAHFSRSFKATFFISPSHYKRSFKQPVV